MQHSAPRDVAGHINGSSAWTGSVGSAVVVAWNRARSACFTLREGVRGAVRATSWILRILHVAFDRQFKRSDCRRWSDSANLELWWESRTRRLARLVPAGSRVIEFGAGRRQLPGHLGPGCTYFPSDLADRGPDTFICDLNRRPFPSLGRIDPDVAVFGGVLEYVLDAPAVVQWLSHHVTSVVASYACVEVAGGPSTRIRDWLWRTYYGYMNHYTENAFVAIFAQHGFQCVDVQTWDTQRLFHFVRVHSHQG